MNDPFAGVNWLSAEQLGICGLGWKDEAREQPFDRFPIRVKPHIPEKLWSLACQPAGEYIEFHGAPTKIYARWHLSAARPQKHCAKPLAESGLDCYARDETGAWRWAGSRTPWNAPNCNGSIVTKALDGKERDYRVYLPLANRIDRLEIGAIEPLHVVTRHAAKAAPIVYYGTSIVHGEGVGRSGMTHASQIGRKLNHEVINLGFCGRAWCELAVAEAMSQLDATIFIVDCLPNNKPEELQERLRPFLQILRQAQSKTPILLVEDREFGGAQFQPELYHQPHDKNAVLHAVVNKLRTEGFDDLHLARHPSWFGEDGEGTEDGSHPNDLGAWRMATALSPIVDSLIKGIK